MRGPAHHARSRPGRGPRRGQDDDTGTGGSLVGAVEGSVVGVGVALSDGTDEVSVTGGGDCCVDGWPTGAPPPLLSLCFGPSSPRVGLSGAVEEAAEGCGAEAEVPSEGPALGSPGLPSAGAPGVAEGSPEAVPGPPEVCPGPAPGVEASGDGGGVVGTPGWRIGAMGGFFGSGCGVTPDIQA